MRQPNMRQTHTSGARNMRILYGLFIALFLFAPLPALSDTLRYIGIIKVKNVTVPAKATYEVLDYMPDPKIQIKYEISDKEYLSVYMSDFGDKFNISADSIEVYNLGPDKKQNYHFSGKRASWLEYSMY